MKEGSPAENGDRSGSVNGVAENGDDD